MEKAKKIIKIFLSVTSLITLISCNGEEKWDCFSSAKKIDSVYVSWSTFDSVYLKGRVSVRFVQTSDSNGIKIVAAQDLLNNVHYHQKGRTLYIEEKSKCNWVRNLHYYPVVWVYFTSHNFYVRPDNYKDNFFVKPFHGKKLAIDYWVGRGTTYVRGEADSMYFWVNAGGGSFVVQGKAQLMYVYHNGNSKLFFKQLAVDTLFVDQRSNNDIFVKVNKVFTVSIHYVGNVFYVGMPSSLLLKKSGKGELIHVDE